VLRVVNSNKCWQRISKTKFVELKISEFDREVLQFKISKKNPIESKSTIGGKRARKSKSKTALDTMHHYLIENRECSMQASIIKGKTFNCSEHFLLLLLLAS